VREFAAYLQSFNTEVDTTKFKYADRVINGTDLRVSYDVWKDITSNQFLVNIDTTERSKAYIEAVFDQYNIRAADTSKDLSNSVMAGHIPKQFGRPDVLLFNAANAFAIYRQHSSTFRKWMQDLRNVTADILFQRQGAPKMFWYGNPFVQGTAHPGTEYITQARNILYNKIAE
jgi:hypothetical protein